MSENVENIKILLGDSQRKNFKDQVFNKQQGVDSLTSSIKGFVQVHETNEDTGETSLIRESNNLIVYPGRAMALCRLFGKDLDYQNNTQVKPYIDMTGRFISWFAVGTGGASSTNNQNPLVVNSTDYQLNTHGTVAGASKVVTVNGRTYMGFDDGYVKYIPEPEIINNDDIYTAMRSASIDVGSGVYKRDSYLIGQVQVTLEAAAANGSSGQAISECGLFMAPSDDHLDADSWWNNAPYDVSTNHLDMFARVTFPTITKNAQRSFTIMWYIFM